MFNIEFEKTAVNLGRTFRQDNRMSKFLAKKQGISGAKWMGGVGAVHGAAGDLPSNMDNKTTSEKVKFRTKRALKHGLVGGLLGGVGGAFIGNKKSKTMVKLKGDSEQEVKLWRLENILKRNINVRNKAWAAEATKIKRSPVHDAGDFLGLSGKEKTKKQVETAYKTMAMKHHPDKGGSPAKFRELSKHYTTLKGSDFFKKLGASKAEKALKVISKGKSKFQYTPSLKTKLTDKIKKSLMYKIEKDPKANSKFNKTMYRMGVGVPTGVGAVHGVLNDYGTRERLRKAGWSEDKINKEYGGWGKKLKRTAASAAVAGGTSLALMAKMKGKNRPGLAASAGVLAGVSTPHLGDLVFKENKKVRAGVDKGLKVDLKKNPFLSKKQIDAASVYK